MYVRTCVTLCCWKDKKISTIVILKIFWSLVDSRHVSSVASTSGERDFKFSELEQNNCRKQISERD